MNAPLTIEQVQRQLSGKAPRGLAYLALIHAGEALAAAWEAYLADVPMTWLRGAP